MKFISSWSGEWSGLGVTTGSKPAPAACNRSPAIHRASILYFVRDNRLHRFPIPKRCLVPRDDEPLRDTPFHMFLKSAFSACAGGQEATNNFIRGSSRLKLLTTMAVTFQDYYEALAVNRIASQEEIQRAYQKIARRYHSDINRSADAEEQFMRISEAYEVPGDPEKRNKHG